MDARDPVVWCADPDCGAQIVGYGFADATNPPADPHGPFLCLFCARDAAGYRPDDITQAFTTSPVPPGSIWSLT